jgi:site-specific DNA-adenine methylase
MMAPKKLSRFFSYYGSKKRLAPKYPRPTYPVIIEPFSGAAGYSVEHYQRDVVLYDVNPVIFGVWNYLINVSSEEILRLPIEFSHVDEINSCQEAKWLIGFWLNAATVSPCNIPSKWMRSNTRKESHWSESIRARIAFQVEHIRHWKVYNSSYSDSPDIKATWFVDPPYNNSAGRLYKNKFNDYVSLGEWCKKRDGQVIVCENEGADWLDFEPFVSTQSASRLNGTRYSKEVIWTKGCEQQNELFP